MLKEIIISIQAYFKAHQFIKEHKLWKWILLPGIIYTLMFAISMYFFSKTANGFTEWLTIKVGLKNWLDRMQSSFLGFFFTLGGMILWMIQMLLYFSLFKYLFLIIGSPVFAYLSEKTEAIIQGKDFPFSFSQLFKDIIRGVRIALRNSVWQTVYMFSILIIAFIPIVGLATPLITILIECYYYGFSMLDYSMERNKKTAAESIFFVSHHKGLAIGNGIVFYLMHLLPFIGWLLAPAYSVIAATISLHSAKQTIETSNQQ
ncbi:MAG: EI24 domain-containing protein [Chitinophagaceae bacterium]